jgi:hypothetical protein
MTREATDAAATQAPIALAIANVIDAMVFILLLPWC